MMHATSTRFTDLDWSGKSPLLFQPVYKTQQSVCFMVRNRVAKVNIYPGSGVVRARFKKATAMSSRTRVKHEISFGQRLANEAQRAREMAVTLPPGKKRDALLEKARLADLAARINGWLASPELKSQQ
jgi:hypothetical protein